MKKSRWNRKIKLWHDRKCKRNIKCTNVRRCSSKANKAENCDKEKDYNKIVVSVPEQFSFVDNTEETMAFIDSLKRKKSR